MCLNLKRLITNNIKQKITRIIKEIKIAKEKNNIVKILLVSFCTGTTLQDKVSAC